MLQAAHQFPHADKATRLNPDRVQMNEIRRLSIAAAAVLAILVGACQSNGSGSAPGQPAMAGESLETAIVLPAKSSLEGVPMEYAYIRKNYPGWQPKLQSLVPRDGRFYDEILIVSPSGEERKLYFDITDWVTKTE